ncbi:MAG: serine/threonine protein kinase [Anaerolineales bacterium]|nr:serine/threonine protein kinase [Anaerolineales bacterium]
MGALYLASEKIAQSQRLVVIKEMLDYYDPKDPQGEEKARKRFEAEAGTLASMNIPGIPQIFDYFTEGGRYYIVMPFIEGENLETGLTHLDDNGQLVKGKPYPLDKVRQWGARLCRILENLAIHHVIHMDIKPANLIVDKSGEIWLVDFGTAKSPRAASPGSQVGLQKSSIYGTVGYAPPEQVAGKPEARSDVYALAATLYHLMTDDDPREPPHDFSHLGRLPKDIARALQLALTKDVHRRIHAAELGHLLEPHSGPRPAFRWQDGTISHDPGDLVMTANRLWVEALEYFKGDDWIKWFKDLHRHDLVARLQAIRSKEADSDLALDALLRELDPSLPPPRLFLSMTALDAGILPWQAHRHLDMKAVNLGGGCLRAQVVNITPGLRVKPDKFTTHDACPVKVTVDGRALSPSSSPQTLHLDIDGGKAGTLRLPVTVTIPEPELHIHPPNIDAGPLYRGEAAPLAIRVSNPGKSPFVAEAHSDVGWVAVKPAHFRCAPGASQEINLTLDSTGLSFGECSAQISITARAGSWQLTEQAHLAGYVSPWKSFIKYWLPPLAWVTGWLLYGTVSAGVLGMISGRLIGALTALSTGILVGALIGMLVYAFPAAIGGSLGALGTKMGPVGTRQGIIAGVIPGLIAGGIAGGLAYRLLFWLGIGISGELGLGLFGALIGMMIGTVLGIALWFLPRQ